MSRYRHLVVDSLNGKDILSADAARHDSPSGPGVSIHTKWMEGRVARLLSQVSASRSFSGPKPTGAFRKCCTNVGSFSLLLKQLTSCSSVSQCFVTVSESESVWQKGRFIGQTVRTQLNRFYGGSLCTGFSGHANPGLSVGKSSLVTDSHPSGSASLSLIQPVVSPHRNTHAPRSHPVIGPALLKLCPIRGPAPGDSSCPL